MKKFLLTTLAALVAGSMFAGNPPLADGYYRVKNHKTKRFVYIYDNTGKINAAAGSADAGALELWKNPDKYVSDPASILYAQYVANPNGGSYNIEGQGTSVYQIIDHFVSLLRTSDGYLNIYASLAGITKYLDDEETNLLLDEGMMGFNRSGDYRLWEEIPIDAESDNYFGITPSVSAGGKHYYPFYASFPFSFASTGMKAYYVSKYDASMNIAVISELEGSVPGAMPVIVECSSEQPSDNRLNLLRNNDEPYSENLLSGVYFCNYYRENSVDALTPYEEKTMRVLGLDADGKLAFKKYNKANLPANQSYLVVPEGTPDEVTVMTEEEYNKYVVPVSAITLSVSEAILVEGESLQLTATVEPDNAINPTLAWTSSDNSVVLVDETGLVTAVAPGTAIVSAKSTDGSEVEATCTFVVEPKIVLVSDIALDLAYYTMFEGESVTLHATVNPDDATNGALKWMSSDEAVATVDESGVVIAVLAGTAVITAEATDGSGVKASCNITVEKNIILVNEISLNFSEKTIIEGDELQLIATVLPAEATDASIVWSSSDETLATVNETGLVQALSFGIVVITATAADASGVSAACTLTIEPAEGISSVIVDSAASCGAYTLSGVKIRMEGTSLDGLIPGIYVVDGKKVVIY